MLYYPMLWYGMESMVCYEISMLCYEISMLCYVKDKHSATERRHQVFHQENDRKKDRRTESGHARKTLQILYGN